MMGLALKTGTPRFEWQHTRVSGEQFPVEVLLTAMPEESGGKIIHVTWTDITDRKQAEKAVQESEAYYRLLFESSIDAIFVADVQTGQILDSNYQAEQLMGRPRFELLKMNQTDLHSDAEKYRKVFREHIREGIRSPVLRFGEVVHCDGTSSRLKSTREWSTSVDAPL